MPVLILILNLWQSSNSDFYFAYNDKVKAKGKQKCLVHLLGEVKKIGERNEFDEDTQEEFLCIILSHFPFFYP